MSEYTAAARAHAYVTNLVAGFDRQGLAKADYDERLRDFAEKAAIDAGHANGDERTFHNVVTVELQVILRQRTPVVGARPRVVAIDTSRDW